MANDDNLSTTQVADRFKRTLKYHVDHHAKCQLISAVNHYVAEVYEKAAAGFFARRFLSEPRMLTIETVDQYPSLLATLTSVWVRDRSKRLEAKALAQAFKESDFSDNVAAALVLSKFNRAIKPLSSELSVVLLPAIQALMSQLKQVDQAIAALSDCFLQNLTDISLEMEQCVEAITGWVDLSSPITVRYLTEHFPGIDVSEMIDNQLPEDWPSFQLRLLDQEPVVQMEAAAGDLITAGQIEKSLDQAVLLHAGLKQKVLLMRFVKRFHQAYNLMPADGLVAQVQQMLTHQQSLNRG